MATRSFLWRRVLRIVPAYWVALTFFWLVVGVVHIDSLRQVVAYYGFLQIYDRTLIGGGLFQAWSLCTEVSFYLVVAALAVALRRWLPRRRALPGQVALVVVLYLGGVVFRVAVNIADPSWRGLAFTWLPANLDLFALGMGVAVLSAWQAQRGGVSLDRWVRWSWPWWLVAGACLWLVSYVVGHPFGLNPWGGWQWMGRQFLGGLMALGLLVPAAFGPVRAGLIRRGLQWRPVVWVGLVSYGLYLYHLQWIQKVPGWTGTTVGDAPLGAVLLAGFGLGGLCAAISYRLVERPALKLRRRF